VDLVRDPFSFGSVLSGQDCSIPSTFSTVVGIITPITTSDRIAGDLVTIVVMEELCISVYLCLGFKFYR
jgi:hypothetical protein